MLYRLAADLVVILHLTFVVFAIAGGALAFLHRRWIWAHLPCALWAAFIEFAGWLCPLTPLENWLRERGGEAGYEGGFVEHYLMPVLYPENLTRGIQIALGLFVVLLNGVIYTLVIRRAVRDRRRRLTARGNCATKGR